MSTNLPNFVQKVRFYKNFCNSLTKSMDENIKRRIFGMGGPDLEDLALEVFGYQYGHNEIYRAYADLLGRGPGVVKRLQDIPFLPVSFFKTHAVVSGRFDPEAIFRSSGTTGTGGSEHRVKDLGWYRESFMKGFELCYGPVQDWCVIGLLPAYLERSDSSLVVMVDEMIKASGHVDSGFYLYDHAGLHAVLEGLEAAEQKTLLIGVTFALLDFAEGYPMRLRHTVVMETGGMKGRRKEITRSELHAILRERLGVEFVHAEYGMTELLSQAYSVGGGLFTCPPWMRVLPRLEDDPLVTSMSGEGILNIVDLANYHSCSFIATEDIGKVYPNGSFEVAGRVDNSDIRGCSLMVSQG